MSPCSQFLWVFAQKWCKSLLSIFQSVASFFTKLPTHQGYPSLLSRIAMALNTCISISKAFGQERGRSQIPVRQISVPKSPLLLSLPSPIPNALSLPLLCAVLALCPPMEQYCHYSFIAPSSSQDCELLEGEDCRFLIFNLVYCI